MKPTKLVLSGGATKIYSTIGALIALTEKGCLADIHSYAGTSSGSIVVALMSIGCDVYKIKKYFDEIDMSCITVNYYNPMTYTNVLFKKGIHDSSMFMKKVVEPLIQDVCGDKDITFKGVYEKYGKVLVITGACLNRRETHFYQYQSNPDMPIKEAIRISCALPVLFRPILWEGDVLVDGGILENYPVYYFSKGSELLNSKEIKIVPYERDLDADVIGIRFIDDNTSRNPQKNYLGNDKVGNIFEYAAAIFNTVHTSDSRRLMKSDYWDKTITINLGDFDVINNIVLDDETKSDLLSKGYASALSQIHKAGV